MKTYRCACGHTATSDVRGSVKDEMSATGMVFVMGHDGSSIWLCRPCFDKGRRLAADLLALCGGNENLYFRHFLKEA